MSTPIQPPANSGWQVTGQSAGQTQVTTDGRVTAGTIVFFRTGNGTQGNVFVPQDRYSADVVRSMIAAVASQIDAVDSLTG